MHVSGERAGCVRRVMLGRGFACADCDSESFIIKGARWSTTSLPALEVASSCASCATGATTPVSLEEARRCGFDDPPKAYAKTPHNPGPRPVGVLNRSSRPFLMPLFTGVRGRVILRTSC